MPADYHHLSDSDITFRPNTVLNSESTGTDHGIPMVQSSRTRIGPALCAADPVFLSARECNVLYSSKKGQDFLHLCSRFHGI